MTTRRASTMRRRWQLVAAAIAVALSTLLLPAPARAANPCIATAGTPSAVVKNGNDYVRFYGKGECVRLVENMRVTIYGEYRRGTSGTWYALGGSGSGVCAFTASCPTDPSKYLYIDRAEPSGCYYFRSNVRLDVMYKGTTVWNNGVDYDYSNARYIC